MDTFIFETVPSNDDLVSIGDIAGESLYEPKAIWGNDAMHIWGNDAMHMTSDAELEGLTMPRVLSMDDPLFG